MGRKKSPRRPRRPFARTQAPYRAGLRRETRRAAFCSSAGPQPCSGAEACARQPCLRDDGIGTSMGHPRTGHREPRRVTGGCVPLALTSPQHRRTFLVVAHVLFDGDLHLRSGRKRRALVGPPARCRNAQRPTRRGRARREPCAHLRQEVFDRRLGVDLALCGPAAGLLKHHVQLVRGVLLRFLAAVVILRRREEP